MPYETWLKSPQCRGSLCPHKAVLHTGWRCTPVVLVVVVLCCPLQKVLQTSDELVIAEHSHTARKAPHVITM